MKLRGRTRFRCVRLAFSLMLALASAFGVGCSSPQQSTLTIQQAVVTRVIDGDTVELANGERVRYLGIDAPETVHPSKPVQPYGPEASARNKELVEAKTVYLQRGTRDRDEYGRLLRYVYVDGTFVNAELVAEGLARAYIFDPDDWYSQTLVQLEQYAKIQKIGLWSENGGK